MRLPLALVLLPLALAGPITLPREGAAEKAADASAVLFADSATPVPTLELTLALEDVERLRQDPRGYVPARLVERGKETLERVGVRLKGAAGSFRPVDERPCFTLDVNRFVRGQEFHGLARLHLNNSVQDETLLCEALGAEIFAAAGLPAARVGHARVWLNGRDLGLYVLKEGLDRRFLARHFDDPDGNLYDGGFLADVDTELERDEGRGVEDRSDLKALAQAASESDLTQVSARLARVLDVERFLRLVALERMLGHWDGYAMNSNNYRVYMRPGDGRAVFIPHGMDQLFQDPEASVLDDPVGMVALAALSAPDLRVRYRQALRDLAPLFDGRASLLPRLARLDERLRKALPALGPEALEEHARLVRELGERLAQRAASLAEQRDAPDPPALVFDRSGRARLTGWRPEVAEGEPTLEEVDHLGRRALAIRAPAEVNCVAAWRRRVTLARGRYRLEASVAQRGVVARPGELADGAALRISGAEPVAGTTGSSGWRGAGYDFEVEEKLRRVELVLELRAARGRAYFALESLRLVRRD